MKASKGATIPLLGEEWALNRLIAEREYLANGASKRFVELKKLSDEILYKLHRAVAGQTVHVKGEVSFQDVITYLRKEADGETMEAVKIIPKETTPVAVIPSIQLNKESIFSPLKLYNYYNYINKTFL